MRVWSWFIKCQPKESYAGDLSIPSNSFSTENGKLGQTARNSMTRGDRDRAMMLQDEVSEMSGHIISFSWPLGEHGGWSWRLWDLYLAFLSFLETQEDYTFQPSQSGGATWQFLTKEICVGECFLSPWKPLLGFSSPTLESQFILSRANTVLASAKQERSVLLCFLPFGVLWMCGGKQECRWVGKRGGNLGDCAQHCWWMTASQGWLPQ